MRICKSVTTRSSLSLWRGERLTKPKTPSHMLNWAITFLVIALIAAIFGFGVLAGTSMQIAKILFFVFIVLFIISFFMGKRTPKV